MVHMYTFKKLKLKKKICTEFLNKKIMLFLMWFLSLKFCYVVLTHLTIEASCWWERFGNCSKRYFIETWCLWNSVTFLKKVEIPTCPCLLYGSFYESYMKYVIILVLSYLVRMGSLSLCVLEEVHLLLLIVSTDYQPRLRSVWNSLD